MNRDRNSLPMFCKTRRSAQCGQAIVEFVVLSGVLVALFLGVWYLGKFHDVQASTIQAARYAAWERTSHAPSFSDARIQQQTRARLFGWDRNPLRDSDGLADNASWATQTAMWRAHHGSDRILDRPRDVTVSTASGALPGKGATAIGDLVGGLGSTVGALGGGEKLNQGGFYTSRVAVKLTDVASLPAPLNALNLTLRESHAVATDSWDASGPKQVAARTEDFTPTGVLDKIGKVLQPVDWALSILEPSFRDFHPGQICPDVVPADRLGNGARNPAVANGQGPCS